jgi:SpoVK/Ycf46/Vps4 family AAA+-type ATPase
MNNHLTSTLLKALDTFSGIMIITTNSMASFDKAFMRRFLFKIELPLPDAEAKKQLIHQYLPELQANDPIINELLENNLSGADLENLRTLKTLYSTFSENQEAHPNYIRNYLKGSQKVSKMGFLH